MISPQMLLIARFSEVLDEFALFTFLKENVLLLSPLDPPPVAPLDPLDPPV